jgi:hypothetical protein
LMLVASVPQVAVTESPETLEETLVGAAGSAAFVPANTRLSGAFAVAVLPARFHGPTLSATPFWLRTSRLAVFGSAGLPVGVLVMV